MVIFFSAAGTLTWGTIFGALTVFGAGHGVLAMPEYAVGFLVMQVTRRIRMPLNAAVAAPLSRAMPQLSLLKISPLLACFAADAQTHNTLQRARRRIEEHPRLGELGQRCARRFFSGTVRLGKFLEGPIDKYGLAYFLTSKVTSVAVLGGATAAAAHGLDVPGMLAAWGFTGKFQNDAGLLAAAAVMNVLCTPVHFLGATGSVRALEGFASRMWEERQEELQSLKRAHASMVEARAGGDPRTGEDKDRPMPGASDDEEPLTELEVQTNVVTNVSILVLILDMMCMFYVARRLFHNQMDPQEDEAGGTDGPCAKEACVPNAT